MRNKSAMELMRGIVRLFTGFGVEDSAPKRLCLSHNLFRPTEKVDAAFIEAVGLLGDLDKELSKLSMKVGKMYGQHLSRACKHCIRQYHVCKTSETDGKPYKCCNS